MNGLDLFLLGIALVLFFEGILYALFPDGMKRMMVSVLELPSSTLRIAGLVTAIAGLVFVWLVHG